MTNSPALRRGSERRARLIDSPVASYHSGDFAEAQDAQRLLAAADAGLPGLHATEEH